MSLSILSNKLELQENTFKNVALASLYSKLDFSSRENSLKEDGHIEIWITKRFGNGEDDYDFFSMNIHGQYEVINFMSKRTINNEIYYSLAGTDNTPDFCYNFSLAYLRLRPNHLISIHDVLFSLNKLEEIECKGGWHKRWYEG